MKNPIPHKNQRLTFLGLMLLFASFKAVVLADVYTVTHTGFGDTGSLSWAVRQANEHPGMDQVHFDLDPDDLDPKSGTFLFLGEDEVGAGVPLPAITDPIVVDGLTQPNVTLGPDGWPTGLLIEIKRNPILIRAGGSGSSIRGLIINESPGHGISMERSGYNTIMNCFIGTDATGTVAMGNQKHGVHADPAFCNLIRDNLISGNAAVGLNLNEHGPQRGRNIIRNNRIGTDITGTRPLGNRRFAGIYTWTGDNIIEENIIAFNGEENNGRGIVLDNRWNNSSHNLLRGNRIFENHGAGVHMLGSSHNNLITDNRIYNNGRGASQGQVDFKYAGVVIDGPSSHSNVFSKNAFYGNAGLNFDLGNLGPSLPGRQPRVGDQKPILNAPVLDPSESKLNINNVTVSGSLQSQPNQTHTIELFGHAGDTQCLPMPKPVVFLDGKVHVKNVFIGKETKPNDFTPDYAKAIIDQPGNRSTYQSEYDVLVFNSPQFAEISARFPILEQGSTEEQDNYASFLSGSFRVASDANGNGKAGETVQLTFRFSSDDRGRFTILGTDGFQATESATTDSLASIYQKHDSLLANYSSPNAQLILLKEGQSYRFEGYHSDTGGEQEFGVAVALGNVRENLSILVPIASSELLGSMRYHSLVCGDSAFSAGQAEVYLGSFSVHTDAEGLASFHETLVADVDGITSLATTATLIQNGQPVQTSETSEAIPLKRP